MTRRIRLAASAGALGAALLVLLPLASRAKAADGPALAGLSMAGTARGFQINFAFQDFVLGNFVDVAAPHASTELSSAGGGSARAVAAQVFPGDLVAGNKAVRENFPGFREANYPANSDTKKIDQDDDTNTNGALARTAGPITIDTSHLKTHASETAANARVTTQRFALAGSGGPLLQMTSMETSSDANGVGNTIVEQARTVIRDLTLAVSDQLTIRIGQISSTARSTSNGEDGDASATFTISDAEAILAGQHYRATIDQSGIRLTGFPDQAPSVIPQSLSQEVGAILDRFGISITTSKPVEIVDGASADATVGGLLITLRGAIPSVFTPDAVKVVYAQVLKAAEPALSREICPPGGKGLTPTGCFALQEICPALVAPLCITPQVVPGPGTGFTTSFAIGLAHAAASAATPFELGAPVPPGGFGGGGFGGGTTGGIVTPPIPGFTPNPGPQIGQPQPQARGPLTGLVAKMPPGVLLGTGGGFLVLALGIAMGPSLRRWRSTAAP